MFKKKTSNEHLTELLVDRDYYVEADKGVVEFRKLPKLKRVHGSKKRTSVVESKILQCCYLFRIHDATEKIVSAAEEPVEDDHAHSKSTSPSAAEDDTEVQDPVPEKKRSFFKKLLDHRGHSHHQHTDFDVLEQLAWQAKLETLQELAKYMSRPPKKSNPKPLMTSQTFNNLIAMIKRNLFQVLPAEVWFRKFSRRGYCDPIDGETSEWHWQHIHNTLILLLEVVKRTTVKDVFHRPYMQMCIEALDARFVRKLLFLGGSQNRKLRHQVVGILGCMYEFPHLKKDLRRMSLHITQSFVNNPELQTEFTAGTTVDTSIRVMTKLLVSLARDALPQSEEFHHFFFFAVLPLYTPHAQFIARYWTALQGCVNTILQLDPLLISPLLFRLFRVWPGRNSWKQELFLHQLDDVFDLMTRELEPVEWQALGVLEAETDASWRARSGGRTNPRGLQRRRDVRPVLFSGLSRVISAPHFEVTERALKLFDNHPPILNITFSNEYCRNTFLPQVYRALLGTLRAHPFDSVRFITAALINHLEKSSAESKQICDQVWEEVQAVAHPVSDGFTKPIVSPLSAARERRKAAWKLLESRMAGGAPTHAHHGRYMERAHSRSKRRPSSDEDEEKEEEEEEKGHDRVHGQSGRHHRHERERGREGSAGAGHEAEEGERRHHRHSTHHRQHRHESAGGEGGRAESRSPHGGHTHHGHHKQTDHGHPSDHRERGHRGSHREDHRSHRHVDRHSSGGDSRHGGDQHTRDHPPRDNDNHHGHRHDRHHARHREPQEASHSRHGRKHHHTSPAKDRRPASPDQADQSS